MRRNIRLHVALLFAVAGLGLSLYGGYRLQTMPVYSEKDLELATELNLSLDLARIPPDRQPPAEELPKLREGVRAEVEADMSRDRNLAKSWLQTGLVLLAMSVLQVLLQRWTARSLARTDR
ncbi:hypothetical protein [Nevskia sp.]|uniref:hypothetical protein n=1 Tax=Nevskia sp. TaxID=1929292 RepID=UPI0025FE63D6|nr:hypothetical protein [Nevskia sp.]